MLNTLKFYLFENHKSFFSPQNLSLANEKDLSSLSASFKNVGELKKQYAEIEFEVRCIEAYYGQISDVKEDLSERIRLYYYNIYLFDKEYENWDLTAYLSEVNIVQLIFGKYWTRNINTANGLYFNWYEDNTNDGKMTLKTNVPNKLESGKQYTYGVKYKPEESNSVIIYYTNINDKEDTFDAYRVSNFRISNDYYYFDVQCIKNETLYSLSTKVSF